MEMSGSDSDAASDVQGLHAAQDNLYEISSNGLEARTPKSTVLPIYDADIACTTRRAIIDTGASTLYISQRIVQELGLQATKIKDQRVKVADHSCCTVDIIATVDVKVFPSEQDDEGYESSNKHEDEYEDDYRDRKPSTHHLMMSRQRHRNGHWHGQALRDGRGGERQKRQ
jgi:hypothetical protein